MNALQLSKCCTKCSDVLKSSNVSYSKITLCITSTQIHIAYLHAADAGKSNPFSECIIYSSCKDMFLIAVSFQAVLFSELVVVKKCLKLSDPKMQKHGWFPIHLLVLMGQTNSV